MSTKISFVSLGCDKNLVDSEVMLGICQREGFEIIQEEEQADVIVVNTCCFIKDALEESIQAVIDMGQLKEDGNCKALIVAGCMAQRYEKEIFDEMPEIDAVLGTSSYEKIAETIKEVLAGKKQIKNLDFPTGAVENEENSIGRTLSTAGHFAYLKIAEGCNMRCTYCVIPSLRGNYRSRTMDSLVKEAEMLAANDVKELIIVAQDTAPYGIDLYGKNMFHELLKNLAKIEGIEWIRVLYAYPEDITDETIEVMASEKKIVKYLDMPIQHGCDTVLKRMGRRSTGKQIEELVKKLRTAIPDITIRTTVITGFPQETEEEFNELKEFVSRVKFDRLGAFAYSQEEGTPAAEMDGQIDEEIKESRKDEIMEIQKGISAEICEGFVGKELEVIIEGKLPEDRVYCARSYRDAPDIDGLVFVSSEEELLTGEFVKVTITAASDYDLYGTAELKPEITEE